VAFSPGGQRIASDSWDGTVRVWDARMGLETLILKRSYGGFAHWLNWIQDGEHIIVVLDGSTLQRWYAPSVP
jgi:WD40 repeat protein